METKLTRTAHPAVHLAVGAWHARSSRRLVASVEALLPDVAAAVEHVTGQALPLTVVHINSLAAAAVTIETGAHRSHLGPQPRRLVLKHIVRSWLGLFLNQARTVRYDHPAVQVFLNPVLLRHVHEDELVRVLGHELVHGVQLVHPASTGYGADVANNYKIARYTPLQAAEANATVALHEVAAYRLEDQIVEVTRWHQAGLLGEPKLDLAVDPTQPVTDLIDHVDALTSRAPQYAPLQLLEELRDAAPVSAVADMVEDLVLALEAEGQYLIADRLEEARQQLRTASELLVEAVEPNAMELYLRDILGDDGEEFTFKPADVTDTDDADPVTLTLTAATSQAGVCWTTLKMPTDRRSACRCASLDSCCSLPPMRSRSTWSARSVARTNEVDGRRTAATIGSERCRSSASSVPDRRHREVRFIGIFRVAQQDVVDLGMECDVLKRRMVPRVK